MRQTLSLFLGLLLTLFSTQLNGQVTPIALTASSFNFDGVAESTPPSSHTSGCMPGGDVLYGSPYPGAPTNTGMPASGVVTSGGITFNLQPYTANNSLQLTNVAGSNGTMTFETPATATALHFMGMSVYGITQVNIVVNFADNTTEQIATNYTIGDWFNGSPVAYTLNGRTTCGGSVYNVNSGNPRLYRYSFNISAGNHSKAINSVTITRTGGPSTSKPYFFSISGTNVEEADLGPPVPTMGEWALIIFALIIMNMGVVTVMRFQKERNRQLAAAKA